MYQTKRGVKRGIIKENTSECNLLVWVQMKRWLTDITSSKGKKKKQGGCLLSSISALFYSPMMRGSAREDEKR